MLDTKNVPRWQHSNDIFWIYQVRIAGKSFGAPSLQKMRQAVQAHCTSSASSCHRAVQRSVFYGTEILCENRIVLINEHLNLWHKKLYIIDYESNLITYCISQQIKWFNPSNSSHQIAKNTENMILKLLKLVLNHTDLGQMLDTKKMRLVDIFPMIYHSHCLNLSSENCGEIIWCPVTPKQRRAVQPHSTRSASACHWAVQRSVFFAGRKFIVKISSFWSPNTSIVGTKSFIS
jgi:hypothetical protein